MSAAACRRSGKEDRTFRSFVRDSASARAFAAAIGLARRAVGAPQALMLWGPPGVGKTHLLAAILGEARARFPSAVIVETTAVELVNRLLAALPDRTRLPWSAADLLVVDDLHVLAGKPVTQREVGRLLGAMVDRGARVACATGGPADRIPVLADAVRELPGGRLIEMPPTRSAVMRRILARKAAVAGISLTRINMSWMVDRAGGDVRRALGALNSFHLYRARDLAGVLSGLPGLSSARRHLRGYGRS